LNKQPIDFVFQVNFWNSIKSILTDKTFKSLDDVDFSDIIRKINRETRESSSEPLVAGLPSGPPSRPANRNGIYFLTGNLTVDSFFQYCADKKIDPHKTVVVFPGNVGHHAPNHTLYSKKSGSGLATFTGKLYERRVPTLSLPTVGVSSGRVTDVSRKAVGDLWKAIGYGANIALPVRPYTRKYFPRPLADVDGKPIEPSFWGAANTTSNEKLAEYYVEEIDKINAYLKTGGIVPREFTNDYEQGVAAKTIRDKWYLP